MSVDASLKQMLERELVVGLASPNDRVFVGAVRVLLSWLDKLEHAGVARPNDSVLLVVASRLSTNDGGTLAKALTVCARILRSVPSGRLGNFAKLVVTALESLIPYIAYSRREDDRPWSPPPRIAFVDVPDIRAGMAAVLSALSNTREISRSLAEWLAEAQRDSLPEVRRAASGD